MTYNVFCGTLNLAQSINQSQRISPQTTCHAQRITVHRPLVCHVLPPPAVHEARCLHFCLEFILACIAGSLTFSPTLQYPL